MNLKLIEKNRTQFMQSVISLLSAGGVGEDNGRLIVPINAIALGVESVASCFADELPALLGRGSDSLVVELFNFPDHFALDFLDEIAILLRLLYLPSKSRLDRL